MKLETRILDCFRLETGANILRFLMRKMKKIQTLSFYDFLQLFNGIITGLFPNVWNMFFYFCFHSEKKMCVSFSNIQEGRLSIIHIAGPEPSFHANKWHTYHTFHRTSFILHISTYISTYQTYHHTYEPRFHTYWWACFNKSEYSYSTFFAISSSIFYSLSHPFPFCCGSKWLGKAGTVPMP